MIFGKLGRALPPRRPFGNHPSLETALFFYWKMDETSGTRVDSYGGHSVSPVTNPVSSATGKIGNAARLNVTGTGTLERITDGALNSAMGDMTWSLWVYPETSSQSTYVRFLNGITSAFAISTSSSNFTSTIRDVSSNAVSVVNSLSFTANTWYHLLTFVSAANRTVSLSVNNAAAQSSSALSESILSSDRLIYGTGANLPVRIDEVAVWGRELTSGEKTALYNNGNGITY